MLGMTAIVRESCFKEHGLWSLGGGGGGGGTVNLSSVFTAFKRMSAEIVRKTGSDAPRRSYQLLSYF
jgi:hypothetical protein